MTTEFPEDRVSARHPPLGGAVLVIGGGAVGSLLAWLLVHMVVNQLTIVDREFLELPNLIRHVLGIMQLGQPKAPALAEHFRGTFPFGEVDGIDADFLELPEEEQQRLVSRADVVVGAAEIACHRRINELCLQARVPAVYPGVWVSPRTRDGEVGQILWVLPDQLTPCYECWQPESRGITGDAQAAGGNILDFMQVALVTAGVVAALIDPTNPNSAVLDPHRTAIYVHGFSPTSRDIQGPFPADGGLRSIEVPVLLPTEPCRVCGQGRRTRSVRRAAPPPPPPPPPDFTFTVSTDNLTASVEVSSTAPATRARFSYDWGDGSATTTSPTHTYARADTYTIIVTATNPAGASRRRSRVIRVTPPPPPPPVISLSVSTNKRTAEAHTRGTRPPLGVTFSYDWGDGSGVSPFPSHTYAEAGTYTLTVTATNAGGSSTATTNVEVLPPVPAVSFDHWCDGLTLSIDTSDTTPPGVDFSYDWDDGSAVSTTPSHTYDRPGYYEIAVTGTNAAGSRTRRASIAVGIPQYADSDYSVRTRTSGEVARNWLIALAILVGFVLFIIVIYIANTYRTSPSAQSQSQSQGEGRSGNQAPPPVPFTPSPAASPPSQASASPSLTITTPAPSAPAQSAPVWTSPDSFPITYPGDMTTACAQQFGPGAYADLSNVSQPSYDIVCVWNGQAYTGLNLDAFCPWLAQQDHYLSPASAPGWWSGNPERSDQNASDQPWMDWRCYNTDDRP